MGGAPAPATPGASQVGGAAVRLGLEIDQALKTLAQVIPTAGPWVEKTVLELRQLIGQALNTGQTASSPEPPGSRSFPVGGAA